MNQMIKHDSLILEQIFTERAKATDIEIRKTVMLAKFENLIAYYNALRFIAEKMYVITELKRQVYHNSTHIKFSTEEMEILIAKI